MKKKKKLLEQHGKVPKQKGPKDPYDIKTPIPKIYDDHDNTTAIIDPRTLSVQEQQQILNANNNNTDYADEDDIIDNDGMQFSFDMDDEDDLTELGTLMGGALRSLRHEQQQQQQQQKNTTTNDEIENQMRLMDYFTSESGSTEDLVGTRRAVSMETYTNTSSTTNVSKEEEAAQAANPHTAAQMLLQKKAQKSQQLLHTIEQFVDHERSDYMDLPTTDVITEQDIQKANSSSNVTNQIPPNQLAHGPWGEMLIRTDRVSKMWRGGRIISFRALVIGGNVRGCGGFGLGKSFEPQDAVEIACRMAKRNIYFVDRYRNRTLTRDLVGRQNSCKVILRTTTNGLRGNPLCCEILKLFGITNVVAKAYGSRNHYNVCRATFKALLTHESLDDIAMKRGLRLINLQQAKRLGI